jgi:uncharacterized protein YlxW (UPF0749 family)
VPGNHEKTAQHGKPGNTSASSALLTALLIDTLDPGYAQAARRKGVSSPIDNDRRATVVWTVVGCLLIGVVLMVAYLHENRAAPADARTRADLRTRIAQAEKAAEALDRSVAELAGQVDARRSAALPGKSGAPDLIRAELQAGATEVSGPGLRITLGNPPTSTVANPSARDGTTPISQVAVLTDLDVRSVVNELWIDGAEAIAVNGVRLTPISAIRFAGQAVLVDFQPIESPYVIEAVGDSDRLNIAFTDSATDSRYRTLSSAEDFTFTVGQQKKLVLAASVAAELHYAHLPATNAPSATSTPIPSRTPETTSLPTTTPSPGATS